MAGRKSESLTEYVPKGTDANMSKEAYYFPHDNNAIQDPKMMTLLYECGLMGVGLYWIVIEILHQQESGMITAEELTRFVNFYSSHDDPNDEVVK